MCSLFPEVDDDHTTIRDVDCNLRALAGRAEGFGRFAVGGLHGDLCVVTSLVGLTDNR